MKKIWVGILMAASALGIVPPSAAQERSEGGRRLWNGGGGFRMHGEGAPSGGPSGASPGAGTVQGRSAVAPTQLPPPPSSMPTSSMPSGGRGIAVGEPNPAALHDEGRRDGHDVGRGWNRSGRDGDRQDGWRDGDRRDGDDGRRFEQGRDWSREGRGWQDNRVGRYDRDDRWDRGWRDDDRYDWRNWRGRNGERFRMGRYDAPRGWSYGYRRLNIGIFLSSRLYDRGYWIDDPYHYRLPPAYGPYRWIRYYDDALLIDIRTGYVVDVVYRLFW